jgi:hypothetical protein
MFSNLMGGSQPTTAPQGQQASPNTPGSIPASAPNTGASSHNTAPNGTVPTISTNAPKSEPTPLDQFKDLWETTPTDQNAPKPTGIFGEVDPKKFSEAAGKIDFSKAVTPEQLQAISQGGDAAMKSFAEALNKVAQNVYAQSAFATTKIVEQALSRSKDSFIAELPTHIKKHTVSDNLRAENPIFSNPAVQPIISALEAQLTVKYPNATAGEITETAKKYVEALGSSFAPKPAETTATRGKPEEDWDKFFNS